MFLPFHLRIFPTGPLKTIPPSGNNAFNKALLGDDGIEHKSPFNNKPYFKKGGNNVATSQGMVSK